MSRKNKEVLVPLWENKVRYCPQGGENNSTQMKLNFTLASPTDSVTAVDCSFSYLHIQRAKSGNKLTQAFIRQPLIVTMWHNSVSL